MYTLNNLPGRFFCYWDSTPANLEEFCSPPTAVQHPYCLPSLGPGGWGWSLSHQENWVFYIYIYISPAGFLVLTVCNMSLDSLKNLLPEGKNRNSDHGTYDICNGDTAMGVACWINITKGSFFWKTSHKWWGRSLQHSKTEAWKNFLPSPQSRMKYCSNFLE